MNNTEKSVNENDDTRTHIFCANISHCTFQQLNHWLVWRHLSSQGYALTTSLETLRDMLGTMSDLW